MAEDPESEMYDLPSHIWVNEDCWEFLQTNMAENANQYELTVAEVFDSRDFPNAVHDLIEVWIDM